MDDIDDVWRRQLAEISKSLLEIHSIDYGKLYAEQMTTATAAIKAVEAALAAQSVEFQNIVDRVALPQFLPTSEIFSNLSELITPFQFDSFQKSWEEAGAVIAEAMERTNDALERVELLASLGWTLPMEMALPDFHALVMQEHFTTEKVDAWFLEYYSDESELTSLKKRLLLSEHLRFWKPLLEQVFRSYDNGDHALCVPALLAMLEGVIAVPWNVAFHIEKNRRRFFERKIGGTEEKSIQQYLWKSVASFVENVFEAGVSENRDHPVPKRNLILHGKSDPTKWNQADCLRLLQGIETILSLYDK